jgi:hypothetical protein
MWCNPACLQGLGLRFAYDITLTVAIYAHMQLACKTSSWDILLLLPLEQCAAKTPSSVVGARLRGRLTPVRNA